MEGWGQRYPVRNTIRAELRMPRPSDMRGLDQAVDPVGRKSRHSASPPVRSHHAFSKASTPLQSRHGAPNTRLAGRQGISAVFFRSAPPDVRRRKTEDRLSVLCGQAPHRPPSRGSVSIAAPRMVAKPPFNRLTVDLSRDGLLKAPDRLHKVNSVSVSRTGHILARLSLQDPPADIRRSTFRRLASRLINDGEHLGAVPKRFKVPQVSSRELVTGQTVVVR